MLWFRKKDAEEAAVEKIDFLDEEFDESPKNRHWVLAGLWWITAGIFVSVFNMAIRFKKTTAVVTVLAIFVTAWNVSIYWAVIYSPIFPIANSPITDQSGKKRPQPPGVAVVHTLADIIEHQNAEWTINSFILSPTGLMDDPQSFQRGVRDALNDMTVALKQSLAKTYGADPRVEVAQQALSSNPTYNGWHFAYPDYNGKLREAALSLREYESALRKGEVKAWATGDNLKILGYQIRTSLDSISDKLLRASRDNHNAQISLNAAGDSVIQGEQVETVDQYRTAYTQIDDNYYYARGVYYVLYHVLRVITVDFQEIIDKTASEELAKQIVNVMNVRYFTSNPWLIMNGNVDEIWANHSSNLNQNITTTRSLFVQFMAAAGSSSKN